MPTLSKKKPKKNYYKHNRRERQTDRQRETERDRGRQKEKERTSRQNKCTKILATTFSGVVASVQFSQSPDRLGRLGDNRDDSGEILLPVLSTGGS